MSFFITSIPGLLNPRLESTHSCTLGLGGWKMGMLVSLTSWAIAWDEWLGVFMLARNLSKCRQYQGWCLACITNAIRQFYWKEQNCGAYSDSLTILSYNFISFPPQFFRDEVPNLEVQLQACSYIALRQCLSILILCCNAVQFLNSSVMWLCGHHWSCRLHSGRRFSTRTSIATAAYALTSWRSSGALH